MGVDRFSLRTKLVVSVLALVAFALTVMAVATGAALRRNLVQRLDGQMSDETAGLQLELDRLGAAGPVHIPHNDEGGGRNFAMPTPDLLESLNADGSLYDSNVSPLPANAPQLGGSALSRTEPITVAGNGANWRVLVFKYGEGYHYVVARNMSEVDSSVGRLAWITMLFGFIVFLAVAAAAIVLVRGSLRPLVEIERTAVAIAGGDLSQRVPERGARSEVGRLGTAFNTMIDRISAAFTARASSEARARRSEDRMRQFFADASHELRTPLTTIQGFAELYRQGAVPGPEERTRLVRRIEDEARRMGLLVEDLLLLARLDQQRPLAAQAVDLTVLAADAVEDAHVIAPARHVSLALPPGGGPVLVTGDEERLRQVVRNLVTNALVHTPPDAAVTVRLGRQPDRATLEVADTGPGLTPEQRQHVFERFYRADPARSRRDGPVGTGLGLAIVSAITAAHAGTVEVDSEPGAGATFRLSLPLDSSAG
ncbi:MAG TPA: HAMP domain-containing sensor histidine kinase [Rugosimonospora sp.]|nr:HAMP domain-containing sensor histidine kinase [Rugosimonospora sp.]